MKNILLGITGGIAAYKSASFARLLIKNGYDVRVIMTASAQAFITPLTLQALTGNQVHIDLLDETAELGMGHIELAKWADLLIIAPATANTIAKLAMGIADDLLTTVCLATAAPILVAPAMNQQMWQHPSVKLNLQTLTDYDYEIIQPASGEQACGDIGEGRLPEPEQLLEYVQYFIARQVTPQVLAGKNVTITAGPTIEAIDPVRYLSNHSTGKMGFALAKACRNAGARVTLIVGGKVPLPTPLLVNRIDVLSAEEMLMTARQCASDDICDCHDDHDHDHHHHDHEGECGPGCGHDHHDHGHDHAHGLKHYHDEEMQSLALTIDGDVDPEKFLPWVNDLVQREGPSILRSKGILSFKDEPKRFVFQGVHMILDGDLQRDWREGEKRNSRIVFIGRHLKQDEIRDGFMACAA